MTTREIKNLSPDTEDAYVRFLDALPGAMLYHSLAYRAFLSRILPQADSRYFLLCEADGVVGALPAFFLDGSCGTVANSLPFYGSHGGILALERGDLSVAEVLLRAFYEYCEKREVVFSTLVESPFGFSVPLRSIRPFDFHDMRIGQFTDLPTRQAGDGVPDSLLTLCHQKTRNMIRKGLKEGFSFVHDNSLEALKALHRMHEDNMRNIGGIAKPWEVFLAIRETFQYNMDYRVYVALEEGCLVSGLLLFYYKDMVEYFCPASLSSHRSRQPLSGLIFTAMVDAVQERGASLWNWGGTWKSQDGVYRFKSRWGARDVEYRYGIRVHTNKADLRGFTQERLLKDYPFFYTLPFSALDCPK